MRRPILVLVAAACGCGPTSHDLHVECGAATIPFAQTHFKDADLLALATGSESHVCADPLSVSLYYADANLDDELARVTTTLTQKGFRKIPAEQAVGTLAVSSSTRDPNLVQVGIFSKGAFEVGLHAERYPNNVGAPFEISLGMFIRK